MCHNVLGRCSECGAPWKTCQCPVLRDSENSAVPVEPRPDLSSQKIIEATQPGVDAILADRTLKPPPDWQMKHWGKPAPIPLTEDEWADLQPAIDAARKAFPQPNEDEWMCVTHQQLRFMLQERARKAFEEAADKLDLESKRFASGSVRRLDYKRAAILVRALAKEQAGCVTSADISGSNGA